MSMKANLGDTKRLSATASLSSVVLFFIILSLGAALLITVYAAGAYLTHVIPAVADKTVSGVLIAQWIGFLIIFLAFAQMMMWFLNSVRHMAYEAHQHRLSIMEWEASVQLAMQRNQTKQNELLSWSGWRKFEIKRIEAENSAEDIHSFYLVPHDKKPIPAYQPGQFLTFQLKIPGQSTPVVRCYSLSDSPEYEAEQSAYRVTIKRLSAPADQTDIADGLASHYFHTLAVDAYLDVKAPSGAFYLDMNDVKPIVLMGAGIGITPILSMLNAIVATHSHRDVWLFYGVQNSQAQIMQQHLKALDQKHPNIHLHICYDQAQTEEQLGVDYQQAEHISIELLQRLLPHKDYEYYLCGPLAMMNALIHGLQTWGVAETQIHWEGFGGKQVVVPEQTTDLAEAWVTFGDEKIRWTPGSGTLLELAEKHNIHLDSGCCAGDCGTCETAIRSGQVTHNNGSQPENGLCLPCVAYPKGDLVLDVSH